MGMMYTVHELPTLCTACILVHRIIHNLPILCIHTYMYIHTYIHSDTVQYTYVPSYLSYIEYTIVCTPSPHTVQYHTYSRIYHLPTVQYHTYSRVYHLTTQYNIIHTAQSIQFPHTVQYHTYSTEYTISPHSTISYIQHRVYHLTTQYNIIHTAQSIPSPHTVQYNTYSRVQYTAKKPSRSRLMKRNGTGRLRKRNGPFTIRSSSVRGPCVFAVRFESVLIKYYYIRTALSALAHGSL